MPSDLALGFIRCPCVFAVNCPMAFSAQPDHFERLRVVFMMPVSAANPLAMRACQRASELAAFDGLIERNASDMLLRVALPIRGHLVGIG